MRLAHLTDLHLPIPSRPAMKDLLNKRALGYLSWARNRRHRHRLEALEAVVADCRRQAPDFVAISGDLVNISLGIEFSAGVQWLRNNFDPSSAAFTPGNHDAYVRLPWKDGAGRLAGFMEGERMWEADRAPRDESDFPFVRRFGEIGLIFANSSPPTAPGLATGRIGGAQLDRLRRELESLRDAGSCRVLILHHPVTDDAAPRRKALDDRRDLRAILYETGVDLVLHGHTHRSVWAEIDTVEGPRPVVGGASASHRQAHGKYRPARYNLFSIDRDGAGGWTIDVEVRELDPAAGAVKTAERRRLAPRTP
jgi:3',5'-cyclic AMP phosphodiesterase CpdA